MTPKNILYILISVTLVGVIAVSLYVSDVLSTGIPSLEQLENPQQSIATKVLTSDGKDLDYFAKEKRFNLSFEQIPIDFKNALISTEDRAFYSHWGLHIERLIKAILKWIFIGQKAGASTITQQLSRNLFLNQAPTLERKIREAYVATKIEEIFTKEQILEMYTNTVYFGRGAYGLNTASKTYFDKKPLDLTTAECAYLVAILKGPAYYDYEKHYDRGLRRRNLVLGMMKDQGNITIEEHWAAVEEPLGKGVTKTNVENQISPHFVENVRKILIKNNSFKSYNILEDGLTVHTTLNSKIQEYANIAIDSHLTIYQNKFDKKFKWNRNRDLLKTITSEAIRRDPSYRKAKKADRKKIASRLKKDKNFVDSVKNAATTIQCGLVVIDPYSGKILAMVGGSPKFMRENYHAKHSLNHTTQIKRQPGSSFKPFVYAMAMQEGLFPDDTINCGPFSYIDEYMDEPWTPRSGVSDCDSNTFVTLRTGLRRSINSVAARLITEYTTPSDVKQALIKAGIKSKLHAVPALGLGAGGEIKPIELAQAYTVFANNGLSVAPYYISKVEDNFGNSIYDKRASQFRDAMPKKIAQQTAIMMEDVVNRGTAIRVRKYFKEVDCAGKTGTTNNNTDAWFTGFTPDLVACVWLGFDDQRITFDAINKDGEGGRAAAPIFGILMDQIYNDKKLSYNQKEFRFKKEFYSDTTSNRGIKVIQKLSTGSTKIE